MWWATGFFGFFSVLLICDQAVSALGLSSFETSAAIVGSGAGGYAMWLLAAVVQIYVMARSAQYKMAKQGTVEGAEKGKGFLS
jgi:hypothetical protein